MSIQKIKNKILPILESQEVKRAGLFGSIARGDSKRGSDIDILVEFQSKDKSLSDLVGLKLDLEEVLKKKVDVLTYDGLNPLLRNIILGEQKIIYEKGASNFS